MLRLLALLCGWRDVQARIHDMSLKLTIQDTNIWEMAERLTRGETFETVYNNIQSPSAILKSHFYSLQIFLVENIGLNENKETFSLGKLVEDVQHCLQTYCRSDKLNTQVVADMQSNLQILEENLFANFTESKQYWDDLKDQKQKTKEKEERQKRSEAKCNANCKEENSGLCNKLGFFLHKFSAIPDTFRQFFPQSYNRRFQKYDFHYLCVDCINNANNSRLKVSDRIANHYGIQIYDLPSKKNEKHSSLQQMLQSLEEDDQIVKNFSLPKQTRDTYEKVILLLFTVCVFPCLGLLSYSC
jgi:hypothetical protein